jgi:hypothetical protein
MADYQTFHSNRRQQTSQQALTDPIGLLSSTIIAGLGMYGLAANGTCLSILAQPAVQSPADELAGLVKETADARPFLVARGGSRVDLRRAS